MIAFYRCGDSVMSCKLKLVEDKYDKNKNGSQIFSYFVVQILLVCGKFWALARIWDVKDLTKLPLGDQQADPECVRSTEWARNDVTCHPELLKPPSRKTFYKQERLVYTQWQLGPSLMFRKSN